MPGIKDFLFGSGTLKTVADTPSKEVARPASSAPAGIDMAKLAQESADRQRPSGAPYPATPKGLSTTMTPQTPNGGTKGNK
jgi:hypothetical protein